MNVLDHLKTHTVLEIKNYCKDSAIDAGVAMMHVSGDFNLSTLIRNANFFGYKQACYVGKKKWDRRGSVGTYHYTDLSHFTDEESFVDYVKNENYNLIAVENNIPEYEHKTYDLYEEDLFYGIDKPMFIFGEEKDGLSSFMLDNSDLIITIQAYGSVRSLNVGTTSGIIMSNYRNYYDKL